MSFEIQFTITVSSTLASEADLQQPHLFNPHFTTSYETLLLFIGQHNASQLN